MKLSVITSVYNCKDFIKETMESVVFQKGDFFIEYIIVDGNSTDGTKEIILDFIKCLNKKETNFHIRCKGIETKFISESDSGMYDGIAKGLELVTGDIVSYINADDMYLPNSFSVIAEVFKNKKVKWLTGINTWYNEKGQIVAGNLPFKYDKKLILEGMYGSKVAFIQQESVFWRKDLNTLIDIDKFRKLRYAGDFYIWHEFAKQNDLYIVKAALSGFRKRKNQLSQDINKYMNEFNSIKDKRSFTSFFKAYYYKFFWNMPDKIKLKLNNNIIEI